MKSRSPGLPLNGTGRYLESTPSGPSAIATFRRAYRTEPNLPLSHVERQINVVDIFIDHYVDILDCDLLEPVELI